MPISPLSRAADSGLKVAVVLHSLLSELSEISFAVGCIPCSLKPDKSNKASSETKGAMKTQKLDSKPRQSRRRMLSCLLVVSLLTMSVACSPFAKKEKSMILKATVVSVAANYLRQIARVELRHLNSLVNWNVYLKKSKNGFKKTDYSAQVRALNKKFGATNHPLFGLGISDVEIDDDFAEITLKKDDSKDDIDIWIRLAWNGSAWLVIDDNLFGKGHLIEEWTGNSVS